MSTKILVVDDEVSLQPLMQQRFRRKIQAGDYVFSFATSGQAALAILKTGPEVDVLLLDINMPDIDGLTLLSQLPQVAPTSRALMVSAYGDLANVRTAMNRGAFDFVMKPIDFKDLELTIDKTARHVGQLRESIHAKAVAELKARFFDNITHEFRTPLSLILAPVDNLLQNPRQDEALRRSLLTIQRNANQLLNLINQLLDLAKLEADSLPLLESSGDVITFLDDVVNSFGAMADQKQLSLTFSSNLQHQEINFDVDKWQKILANLMSNAIKFTAAGGKVAVVCVVGQKQLVLTVADTGVGIPPEHISRIFDRFYQVDASLTRAYEGSGIGLSLAYELTRRLGGHLSVESQPGRGTIFTVELPIQKVVKSATYGIRIQPRPTVPLWVEDHPLTTNLEESDRPLILLVEDNSELITFIAESLSGQYRILTAANGRQGLELAQRELPDIVVSDVMMPEMDGYQLTHQLKNSPDTNHIAVLLLTARSGVQHRREGLLEGADDYLTKPFDMTELTLRLRNMVSRQQKIRDYYLRSLTKPDPQPTLTVPEADKPVTPQTVFMNKLYRCIETHLDESAYRAEALADDMAMSVRTLTRKLHSLVGVSPARLIRTYRLRRACDLLKIGHPVSETAYLVGFEHPTNFATAFKEVYQQTPTEFVAADLKR
ncbi:response regulator [Spirosoma pollinicola]|uniref:histidine kinase n=1 Tax=Spirosoma pollinicola TaxID=2057025 RepID=A0A2K8Z1D0_9BACT|nr:response regulator [Spirosoma pollinicola]AUD03686.1 histidine kinase [Spirosoma pollinicola]